MPQNFAAGGSDDRHCVDVVYFVFHHFCYTLVFSTVGLITGAIYPAALLLIGISNFSATSANFKFLASSAVHVGWREPHVFLSGCTNRHRLLSTAGNFRSSEMATSKISQQ